MAFNASLIIQPLGRSVAKQNLHVILEGVVSRTRVHGNTLRHEPTVLYRVHRRAAVN
jgi:hypothetical protein